ncbi:MAG: hypothetical protein IT442_01825 [Phycisphaeraceae bacterium]|nr:hypothetical protein [Phycisphaeraceae bacterium]
MKNLLLALSVMALCAVTTFSALAAKVGADRPTTQALGYRDGIIDGSTHRARFDSAVNPGCNTPLHKGYGIGHWHDWQTMHSCATTSGNWWNADKTIWQLKRTWCSCEGWNFWDCTGGGGAIKAFCTYV